MQKLSMITTGTFRTGTYSVYTVYSMYSAGQGPQDDQEHGRDRHGQLLPLLPHPRLRGQEGNGAGRRRSHQSHQVCWGQILVVGLKICGSVTFFCRSYS